jgi:NADH-quinone oxidoreductase subunit N
MIVGNLIALRQRSVKRMLAYSSVAHAGYLLVAVWPGSDLGAAALLLYLLAYGLTTLAAFGLLAALGRGGEREVSLDTIAGLGHTRPWVAAALSVCMLSLLGFPGTFGFIGKWYILVSVIVQGQPLLAVVVVLTSVISAGYYLPVVRAMYMREAPAAPGDAPLGGRIPLATAGALVIAVALVLVLGFVPSQLLVLVRESVSGLASAVGQAATGQ